MTRLTSTFVFIALAVLAANKPTAAADGPPSWSTEAVDSDDGKYLLVSISHRPLDEELADAELTGEERDQIEFVRVHYPASGMYRRDGSYKTLWKFDEEWPGDPIVAPDGEHVVFEGPWTWDEHELQAVEFTRRGQPIRSYAESDFISAWWLKRLLNGGNAPSCKGTKFDPAAMTYTITTSQGEDYVFNVASGDIVEVRSPYRKYFSMFGVAVAALVIVPTTFWARRRKARVTA